VEKHPAFINTPNIFTFSQKIETPLKVGKTYILSFKVKGAQITNGRANLFYRGFKQIGTGNVISRGDRGDVKADNRAVEERIVESATYTGGSNWVDVKKEFTIKFNNKELADVLETQKNSLLRFVFQLTPGSGIVQFDDIKLVEK
jgi:hypothetical protein